MRATYLVFPDVQSAILALGTQLGRGFIPAPEFRSPDARILALRVAGAYIKQDTQGNLTLSTYTALEDRNWTYLKHSVCYLPTKTVKMTTRSFISGGCWICCGFGFAATRNPARGQAVIYIYTAKST